MTTVVTGEVLSPSYEPGSPQFTPEEIGLMVYKARMHGKTCMAHAQATAGMQGGVAHVDRHEV